MACTSEREKPTICCRNEVISAMVTMWISIRKMGAAAFAVFFLLGQFHMCQSAYELPSGAKCAVCPTLQHEEASHSHGLQLSAQHNDCHDCCTIAACEDPKLPKTLLAPTGLQSIDLAILPEPILVLLPAFAVARPVQIWQFAAPPTGPPSLTSARAPPFSA
ncbi:MAG: hypothetical protein JNK63_01765 [Chthonomonas sp.]|nr:hypothetical protein [Chthonomonas sp.]